MVAESSDDAAAAAERAAVVRLVVAARTGDQVAFSALYRRFAAYVHAIALTRCAAAHAPDVVQDTFVQAWRRLGDLREPGAFPGWIAAIARHRAADVARVAPLEPLDDAPAPALSPDAAIDAARAVAAIARLPEAYRETLVLRLVEGLTGPEIATLTGLTRGSVRVNLHRGMRLLRDLLGINP